ncbi:PH domain-containing protein [Nocardia sp. NPDC005978]|uniref:PH domain-containing protein n=1 Tax=unclassified Nocardia TaxID=2637762 RepID=UPI0033BD51F4
MGLIDGIMGNAGRIDPAGAQQEYGKLLGQGEQVYAAYLLVRDALLFTNRRLILVDKQGVTGRKVSYHSVPYRAITHFSVETAGTFDLDAELKIWISGADDPLQKRFNRQVDIYEVQGILSHFVAV